MRHTFNVSVRQRITASFLFVVIVVGTLLPCASSVYALSSIDHTASSTNSHIPPHNPNLATNEVTHASIPAAPKPTISPELGAADARAVGLSRILGNSTAATTQPAIYGVSPSTSSSKVTPHEIMSMRTATRSVTEKADGTLTETDYAAPHFYKSGADWTPINNTLTEDTNAADSSNIFGKALGKAESLVSSPTTTPLMAIVGMPVSLQVTQAGVWYALSRAATR